MGNNKEKEIMAKPEQLRRIFNMSGKVPNAGTSTPTHKRIQVGWPKADYSYAIVEFRVYPSNTNVNAQLNGTITLAKDDNLDPSTPNMDNTNELAWATYNQQQGVPPGIGESLTISTTGLIDDENYFDRNIYLHAVDEAGTQDINYWIKLAEFRTKPEVGGIIMLRQFGQLRSMEVS